MHCKMPIDWQDAHTVGYIDQKINPIAPQVTSHYYREKVNEQMIELTHLIEF